MSKQLAISSAASIMAMAAFAVLSAPVTGGNSLHGGYAKGAHTEVSAPSIVISK